jgi:Domain of unknown function (DUF4401)/Predicted membrane protein (DUF2157)
MNSSVPSLASKREASHLFAVSGAISLVLGLIFIIAFNWTGLPSVAKFALLQGLIAMLALGAVWKGLSKPLGKGLLVVSMGCVGPLLAVFGQTYQTGADVWQLFFGWAALGLVWAVAARSASGWLLWVILAQAALWLRFNTYFDLSLFRIGAVPLWAAVGAVNGFLLLAWEVAATKYAWLTGRLAPRLIAAVLVFVMTAATVYAVAIDMHFGVQHPLIGWLVMMLLGYVGYARARHDIVITTFGWVSLASIALALVIRFFIKIDPIFAVFVSFLTLLGALVFGVQWLRKNFLGTSHWIVDIAAGFGAWVAMLFFFLFILLVFGDAAFRSSVFLLAICALCFAGAVALGRAPGDSVFRKQLATVFSLAALTAMFLAVGNIQGISNTRGDGFLSVYAACAVAFALWCFLHSKQTRSLMAIVTTFAFVAMMEQLQLRALTVWVLVAVACMIWLLAPNSFMTDEHEIAHAADNVQIQRLTEFGYAVSLWALLLGVGWRSHDRWGVWYVFWRSQGNDLSPTWASTFWLPGVIAFMISVVVYVGITRGITKANTQVKIPFVSDALFVATMVFSAALSAFFAPYLLACAIFLAIGWSTVRLKLTALAIFGIVAALFEYYFEQSTPLWLKGSVLLALGMLLILAAWRTRRHQPMLAEGVVQ